MSSTPEPRPSVTFTATLSFRSYFRSNFRSYFNLLPLQNTQTKPPTVPSQPLHATSTPPSTVCLYLPVFPMKPICFFHGCPVVWTLGVAPDVALVRQSHNHHCSMACLPIHNSHHSRSLHPLISTHQVVLHPYSNPHYLSFFTAWPPPTLATQHLLPAFLGSFAAISGNRSTGHTDLRETHLRMARRRNLLIFRPSVLAVSLSAAMPPIFWSFFQCFTSHF